jgi:membrane fusion protein, multidrug efflux system
VKTPLPPVQPRRLAAAALVVLVLALVLGAWHWLTRKPPAPKSPPPIAVDMATVKRADVPVYLMGLGTVQAFYTVTVTARVDGQIEKVAFREGQEVKKGSLLVQIDPRPYEAALGVAIATRAKDEASLANAKRDMERYSELAPEDLASKQTVDTQRALIAQLAAQVKGDQAAIDSARTQLDYTTITSPIDGRTGIRLVDPGNIVRAADTTGMVVITQLEPIAVIFTLPEEAFGQLSAALARGSVVATALARDGSEELDTGTVELIDNQIDQTTGTIRIKAILPNKQRRLWPGEFVNVRILTEMQHQVLTVPSAALERGPDGMFTYVVQPDSTISVAPLVAGVQNGNTVVIEKGLEAGQRVVVSNQFRLQPGSHVRANTPAASGAKLARSGEGNGTGEGNGKEPAP